MAKWRLESSPEIREKIEKLSRESYGNLRPFEMEAALNGIPTDTDRDVLLREDYSAIR